MNRYSAPHDNDHIKRPLNSFMVWAKEKRRMMNKNNPKMRNADISKILGEEWRKMPENEKQPYVQQAVFLRQQHKIDYPNYRYRPRRKNSQDPREILDRASPYSRVFSNVYLPLTTSNSPLHGTCLPYNYEGYIPSHYHMDKLDIPTHGIPFQPKLISPYSPGYVFPSNGSKDHSANSSIRLNETSVALKDGPLKMTSPMRAACPGSSSHSPAAVPYIMWPSKGQF